MICLVFSLKKVQHVLICSLALLHMDGPAYGWAFGLPEKFGSGISGFENFGF